MVTAHLRAFLEHVVPLHVPNRGQDASGLGLSASGKITQKVHFTFLHSPVCVNLDVPQCSLSCLIFHLVFYVTAAGHFPSL